MSKLFLGFASLPLSYLLARGVIYVTKELHHNGMLDVALTAIIFAAFLKVVYGQTDI